MSHRPTSPLLARRGDERGQVLVLFTLTLVVLLLISALAVDYGGWLVARRSYQNVADAAALAGAQQLTRPLTNACTGTTSKNQCARQAAWQSLKDALGLAGLVPATQATSSSTKTTAYTESGYTIWVASPPADANASCSSNCPFPGHISGPGDVFVKVEHPGGHYLSRIVFPNDVPVTAWATAGRFPENFAVIGLCNPDAGDSCLANGSVIKVDGNNSFLAVSTGDLGTNGWTKTNGSGSVIGLGSDSNAFMQDFNTCWGFSSNQCQLAGYSGGAVDYSVTRTAVPLGAPVTDPGYAAPSVTSTTTPNQCNGTGTVQLASLIERAPSDPSAPVTNVAAAPDLAFAAARLPATPAPIQLGAPKPTITGTVKNSGGSALGGISISTSPGNFTDTTTAAGAYTLKNVTDNTTYTITATDASGVYHGGTATASVSGADVVAPLITLMKNPVISGTIRDASTSAPLSGVAVTVTSASSPGSTWTGTTNSSGFYSIIPTISDSFTVSGSKSGYITSSGNSTGGIVAFDGSASVSFSLTPAPASLTGTIRDSVTGLGIPGITVSLSPGGYSATTNTSGVYTIASMVQGTYTATLSGNSLSTLPYTVWGSGTTIDGYVTTSPSSPVTPLANLSVAGATTQNFSLWPKGCSSSSGNYGSWDCGYPSGSNCPSTTNANAATVTCTFTQANAIRPGTYKDISINGCAWIDPKGGVTGLASGQTPGIVHIKGQLSLSNNSYLFGDGVTIVMDQGASISVNNGGGFVLNYGSLHSTPGNPATACDLSTFKSYGDGYSPCFRTAPSSDTNDYAYAAWTTKGHYTWSASGTPITATYSSPCSASCSELGITWYLYGTPSGGSGHRFNISTANMGYLFNGVLYGPQDDIALGGGKDGQTAAGQIVGWTIEYHGGTQIVQRWYADPVDGPPFLVEPVLGECFAPVASC